MIWQNHERHYTIQITEQYFWVAGLKGQLEKFWRSVTRSQLKSGSFRQDMKLPSQS